mmetsp:Transcript_43986/g.84027  ORF Transcript_43986/g.84027 Transcript_43986/m.84027 type:complete len:320 (-) Transcript_43986:327-1286(-)
MGSRPCSSASMSDGLHEWNAPEHTNRMWSVFTLPYLVETSDPSMMGSRSRCTPSEDASAPWRVSLLLTILSISSMNTMPSCSTERIASRDTRSLLIRRSCSISSMNGLASAIFMLRFSAPPRRLGEPNILSTLITSSFRGMCETSRLRERSGSSTSTLRSSKLPSRNSFRKASRVCFSVSSPQSMSRILFSTASAISAAMRARSLVRVRTMAASTRSRMIWSTSRPWKPTSVNLVASTLIKGASASLANLRAISVLPHPVGPIIRMFLGTISSFIGEAILCLRQRLRSAIATARFASGCPTMYRSSISTTFCGVMPASS